MRGSITPFDEKTSGLPGVFRRPVLGSSEPRGSLYLYQKHCLHAPTLDGGSIVARCCSMTAHGGFKVALGETKSQVRGSMAAFKKKIQQKCLSLCVAISMGFSCLSGVSGLETEPVSGHMRSAEKRFKKKSPLPPPGHSDLKEEGG